MMRDIKPGDKRSSIEAALFEIGQSPKRKGRRYSVEQQKVIREALSSGLNVFEVQRATGISLATLQNWRKKAASAHFIKVTPEEDSPSSASTVKVFLGNDLIRIELSLSDLTADLITRLKNAL
jgi:transposase-like protein